MNALLQSERAWTKWLVGTAAYLVTGVGTYVQTDRGINVRLSRGFEFHLSVNRGQDEIEMQGPGVIVYCPLAEQFERGSRTYSVATEVHLRYPADEGEHQRDLLEAFEFAIGKLGEAIHRDDLMERLSENEPGWTALHVLSPWVEESGWTPERLRAYVFKAALLVAMSDLGEPA